MSTGCYFCDIGNCWTHGVKEDTEQAWKRSMDQRWGRSAKAQRLMLGPKGQGKVFRGYDDDGVGGARAPGWVEDEAGWLCTCGFVNKIDNEVCGGGGDLGCGAPRPEDGGEIVYGGKGFKGKGSMDGAFGKGKGKGKSPVEDEKKITPKQMMEMYVMFAQMAKADIENGGGQFLYSEERKGQSSPAAFEAVKHLEPMSKEETELWLAPFKDQLEDIAIQRFKKLDHRLKRLVVDRIDLSQAENPTSKLLGSIRRVTSMRHGDWVCPACSHHNFAKNEECIKCGTLPLGSDDKDDAVASAVEGWEAMDTPDMPQDFDTEP